jgi:toxin secretion/phage lysis holin
MKTLDKVLAVLGAIGGAVAQALGGWDAGLQTLLACMAIDTALALAAAWLGKSPNTTNGGISSSAFLQGVFLKVLRLTFVLLGQILALYTGVVMVRDGVITALIIGEVISILETYGIIGFKVPAIFQKVLDILKAKEEGEQPHDNSK